jgi:LPS sulfotransferase NodH
VTAPGGYIICATPRSGSFLLCELMQNTGVAGRPQEYGVIEDEATWKAFHRFGDHAAYHRHFFSELSRTPNGWMGLKLMWPQAVGLAQAVRTHDHVGGAGVRDVIEARFAAVKYIHLHRTDKLRQAISLVMAEETGAWSTQATPPGRKAPAFDRRKIVRALEVIAWQDAEWAAYLEPIAPHRKMDVRYEDVAADLPAWQARLLAWLGVREPPLAYRPPTLGRQAGDLTEHWLRDFGAAGKA